MNTDSTSKINPGTDHDQNGFLQILSARRDYMLWAWIWLFGIMGPGYLQGDNLETSPALAGDTLESNKSVVWDIYGEYAVRRTKVHHESLRSMLEAGIRRLTGLADPNQAWHQFIRDDDVVALVFTRPGSKQLAMNTDVASVLLQSLYDCGFKPGQIMLVGLEELPDDARGTRPCRYGWKKDCVDFLTDSDHLAAWLDEVTAIINVPAIMDDNIIVLRGAIANLTLPILKCPGRLYMNQGDPFLPDIYNLPPIRNKVRLHIGIGLRILYHGGPEVNQVYIYEHGTLLFSTDPIALDQVALQLINRARHNLPLPEGAADTLQCSYLQTAQAMGLGHNDLNRIEYHLRNHNE